MRAEVRGSMIELSITTKSAATLPPAAPVSGAAPGGFARTLDALTDGPPARPDMVDPRHDDAARGKKLPVATAEATDDPVTTATAASSMPVAKPAGLRRPIKPGAPMVAPPTLPVVAATAHDTTSSDDDKKPADDDAATGDDAPAAMSPAAPLIITAPILIDPAPLATPVRDVAPIATRGAANMIANVSFPTTPSLPAGQAGAPAAADPGVAPPPPPGAIAAATAAAGMTALPSQIQLLDAGARKVADAPSDISGVAAPRIATPSQTPHFAIAPATTVPANPPSVAVQPARQAFAAALAALSARAPARDDDDTNDPHQPIAGLGMPSSDTLIQAAVQQVADSSQSALDPRHDRGLNGMIDHIEMLRDDANANDTRIRLTPDALGTVDVAVRRDGAALHVRFSSPNEATRAVLNDAQPRLAALAEARGVRIAGSSIDSGSQGNWGGNAQPQSQRHTAAVSPAGAPRSAAADTDTDTMTDQRLA